jgi:endonuclease/exonuclease/phosphatase family metal-dependent hydrolase
MLKRSITLLAIIALGFANASAQNKDRILSVMTRNLDTGSDFGLVTSATTPLGLVIGVAETYQEVVQSNIPERAQGIVGEIQAQQPDLVGLQEVTTLRIGPFGGPSTTVVADQLQSLMAALAARGLHYAAIAVQENADVNGPVVTDLPVILAGDLNSDADNPDPSQSPAYHILINANFLDVWAAVHPGDPGFTWPLHGEDPSTASSSPNQRIDMILTRGDKIANRSVVLTGNTQSALTPSGLWPSDHAGVDGTFTLLP